MAELKRSDRDEPLRVLFMASEMAPYAKVGGLGDVVGSLSRVLSGKGVDVRVVLPYYRAVREAELDLQVILQGMEVPLGGDLLKTDVWGTQEPEGGFVYFVDREDLYDRPNLYGQYRQGDYYDNLERFSVLSRAGILLAKRLGFRPHIVHAHDWETGAVSIYLSSLYRNDPFFHKTATVFTFHDVAFQGTFSAEKLSVTGIPYSLFNLEGIEFWGRLSLLKGGIVFSDAVTTTSPTYAREVQTPEYGMGMEGVIARRSRDLRGILNGVDGSLWNPEIDSAIESPYHAGDLSGKARCREALLAEMGLSPEAGKGLVIGWVSRLVKRKGVELFIEAIRPLLTEPVVFAVLGTGRPPYEERLAALSREYPDRIALRIGFDEAWARRIVAGSDVLVLPAWSEPSGLGVMIAMRYGTVPVVRRTGALADIVRPYDPVTGDGWGLELMEYDCKELVLRLREAVSLRADADRWRRIVVNAMEQEFSWERPAEEYLALYRHLVKNAN